MVCWKNTYYTHFCVSGNAINVGSSQVHSNVSCYTEIVDVVHKVEAKLVSGTRLGKVRNH